MPRTRIGPPLPGIVGLPANLPLTQQPSLPPSLTNQDATESMTTPGATELLQKRTSGLGEPGIAAWPSAGKRLFPPWVGIALDLRSRAAGDALPFAYPLAVATSLCPAAAFTLFTGAVTTVRHPPVPTASCRSARPTAVAAKGMPWPEAPLATFQKTEATPETPWDVLHRCRFLVTLRWAHRRVSSPTVKSRCEASTSQRGVLYSPAALPSHGNATLQISH
jgi:hypothetical protein